MSGRGFGLRGDPVAHTLSPRLYRAAFEALGIEAEYRAIRVPGGDASELEAHMRALAATGGGNVTLPHKALAAELVERRERAAERTGACNCFWLDPSGYLVGDNTDVQGFLAAVEREPEAELRDADVLLLGAGGAARAVAAACADAGVRSLSIHNRSRGAAERLIADLGLAALATVREPDRLATGTWDVVVNATSLGLGATDRLPVKLDPERHAFAFDLVYGSGGTDWTRHAARVGVPATDGTTMLVAQAVECLARWFGDVSEPDRLRAVMRDAVS